MLVEDNDDVTGFRRKTGQSDFDLKNIPSDSGVQSRDGKGWSLLRQIAESGAAGAKSSGETWRSASVSEVLPEPEGLHQSAARVMEDGRYGMRGESTDIGNTSASRRISGAEPVRVQQSQATPPAGVPVGEPARPQFADLFRGGVRDTAGATPLKPLLARIAALAEGGVRGNSWR